MEGEEGGKDATSRRVSPSSWLEREVGEGGERGGESWRERGEEREVERDRERERGIER